jgi:hypothetical protein
MFPTTPKPPVNLPPSPRAHAHKWILAAAATSVILFVLAGFTMAFFPDLVTLYRQVFHIPPCGDPALLLGTTQYRIQSMPANPIPIPAANSGETAYWMEGTTVNYDLTLNSAAELKPGMTLTIRWGDCVEENYTVTAVESGALDRVAFLDQSSGGIRLFVQGSAAGEGLLVRGARPESLVVGTPEPTEPGAVQADISFLKNDIAADGKTIRLQISIKNNGSQALSLSADKISLGPENGAALPPTSTEPALPQQVAPGDTAILTLTFPYAGDKALVFKLLDFSMVQYY